jgi:hypothetical protein
VKRQLLNGSIARAVAVCAICAKDPAKGCDLANAPVSARCACVARGTTEPSDGDLRRSVQARVRSEMSLAADRHLRNQ